MSIDKKQSRSVATVKTVGQKGEHKFEKHAISIFSTGRKHSIDNLIDRSANPMWNSGYGATHTLISNIVKNSQLGKKSIAILSMAATFEILEELF